MKNTVEATSTIEKTVQNRIASLPEDAPERLKALRNIEKELKDGMALVKGELDVALNQSGETKNMNPDKKLLTEIAGRYDLSSTYGITKEDFDAALAEIGTNEKALAQLHRLKTTGAEMTISLVSASEVLFIDTVDNVNVGAQEAFLSGLDANERSDAVRVLQERFPNIEQLLQRADGERGLHYYDYLLICGVTGAEPMPENEYRELQRHKPVDRKTICWLLTEKERLNRGFALNGDRLDLGIYVFENFADDRSGIRAGRPRLRVQRA